MDDLSTTETIIEPISASADGTRNMYSVQCDAVGQRMNYAACQWRQGVLSKPDIKTPSDWDKCAVAARCNQCPAMQMRKEEEIAGKALYFDDRNVFRKMTDAAKRWASNVAALPSGMTKISAPAGSAMRRDPVVAARHSGSMLDSMGDMGSLADAVTAAAVAPSATHAPVARVVIPITSVARDGESPLQMARRIAAERSATL